MTKHRKRNISNMESGLFFPITRWNEADTKELRPLLTHTPGVQAGCVHLLPVRPHPSVEATAQENPLVRQNSNNNSSTPLLLARHWSKHLTINNFNSHHSPVNYYCSCFPKRKAEAQRKQLHFEGLPANSRGKVHMWAGKPEFVFLRQTLSHTRNAKMRASEDLRTRNQGGEQEPAKAGEKPTAKNRTGRSLWQKLRKEASKTQRMVTSS